MRRSVTAVLLVLSSGCTYLEARLLDLTDVVDVRYGTSLALGAKVEVTDYIGVGAGCGVTSWPSGQEWYGRWLVQHGGGEMFLHAVLIGCDDAPIDNQRSSLMSMCKLGYNDRFIRPPVIDRFRVGGEVALPLVHCGVHLNLGELCDFVLGIFGLDLADDDGLPKGVVIDRPMEWEEKWTSLRTAPAQVAPGTDR